MNDHRSDEWYEYDYAIVRVVPRVHLEAFHNIGVVVHSRRANVLRARVAVSDGLLRDLAGQLDAVELCRFVDAYVAVAEGGPSAGAVGTLPPSERFHWLTAPRSAVIQTSRVHCGRCRDLDEQIEVLAERYCRVRGRA